MLGGDLHAAADMMSAQLRQAGIRPPAAEQVMAETAADEGVLVCTTGTGMVMAANKFPGIRAALCMSPHMADMARKHNDANVLSMGARIVGEQVAIACVEAFLNAEFDGGRHIPRVEKIKALEA